MPIYEYECTKCGHRFELYHEQVILDGISIERWHFTAECPKCDYREVARMVMSAPSLIKIK